MEEKKVEEPDKVPLLLFSGGLDSSYQLQRYLEQGDVETLYVTGSQHPTKTVKEREVRQRIIKVLEERTGNRVLKDHHVEVKELFSSYPQSTFKQPMMWLNAALHVVNSRKHSHLSIAYVAGDQIACKIPYLINAWDNMQYVCKEEHVPVRFPLEVTTKQMILKEIWSEVIQHVWVCETPRMWKDGRELYLWNSDFTAHQTDTIKACGDCLPCLTMAGQLHMWKLRHGRHYSFHYLHKLQHSRNNQRARQYGANKEERKDNDEYQEIQLSPENICDPSVDTLSG